VSKIEIPAEPLNPKSPLIRGLAVAASGLTAASIAVNLILQVAQFMKKRPVEPDQRDRLQTASLTLTILKAMPGLVRQVRLLLHLVRSA